MGPLKWLKEETKISIHLATFNSSLLDFHKDHNHQYKAAKCPIGMSAPPRMQRCIPKLRIDPVRRITVMDKQSVGSHYTPIIHSFGKTVLLNQIS